MAVISVSKTVSGAIALEIVAAISTKEGYQANIPNPDYDPVEFLDPPDNLVPNPSYDPNVTIVNPETDQVFAQRILDERFVEYGKNVLNRWRNKQATDAVTPVNNGDFT